MTEPQKKSETISETTKAYLVEVFVNEKYGRKSNLTNKYVTKGLEVEEDSLTIYSRFKKEIFFKNEEWLKNEFISGTPDIICDTKVIDIKSSWDIFTFFKNNGGKLNKDYYWQLQCYMALTKKNDSTLAYCLTNTPDMLIQDEKRKLMYKMGVIDDVNEDFQKACAELDKLMTYDDIPLKEKVVEIDIQRNDIDIKRLYERVELCRDYMNTELFKKELQKV